ncbi:MAG: glycosyltransferase family 2 protein [Syntrophales bacterium]|nr:glycosyltransferase family 2 protein [Syntrophales bacterium]
MIKRQCIIIPAYNEENRIDSVIENIRGCGDADIIVIDDGSKDFTAVIAQEAGAFVIRHPFNMGYGVALQTGYKYAVKNHYDLLVQMDGDGQHRAEFISELFRQVENDACDVVIGSRFLSQDPYKAGILKTIGISIFRLLIRMITGERITDPTSGYQCLNRKVFAFFTEDHFPCDYPDANVIIMLHRAGFKIKEIPVEMTPNPEGRSMHRGLFTVSYYLFKVFLSIFVTLIRKSK